jgi:hypothetical protein
MKNWKTTLLGAALAVVTFLATYQANGGNIADWKLWVIPALSAALGYVAKDAGVTGSMKLLIATLCLLSLPACSTPEQNARLGQLVTLAIDLAEKRGAITPADAQAIRAAESIILSPPAALPAIDVTSGK